MTAAEPTTAAMRARRAAVPRGHALLPFALKLDAVVTGANGVAYLALAGPLHDLLGLPSGFLRGVGAFLVLFAAAVWLVAVRGARPAATAVIEANGLWVAGSIALLAFGAYEPTTAGSVWIVLQALAVGLFAALQVAGRRRASATRPAGT